MGYDPDKFSVLPINNKDIENFINNIFIPKIWNQLGHKWDNNKFDFNSLEYKMYLGSNIFLDTDGTNLKYKEGSTLNSGNNSKIGCHNSFQFELNGEQK